MMYPDQTVFVPGAGLVERGELHAAAEAASAHRDTDGGLTVEAAQAAAEVLYAGYRNMSDPSRDLLAGEAVTFLQWADNEKASGYSAHDYAANAAAFQLAEEEAAWETQQEADGLER